MAFLGALVVVSFVATLSASMLAWRELSMKKWVREVAKGDNRQMTDGAQTEQLQQQQEQEQEQQQRQADADREAEHEAEEDRVLREATDLMQAEPLRRAIATAIADKHESAALRTAKFVLKHLTDDRAPDTKLPSGPQDGMQLPPGGGGGGDAGGKAPVQPGASDDELPEEPEPMAETELPLLVDARPQKFDWWSYPPPSLAELLPPMPDAAHFAAVPDESPARGQARFDAIVAMAQPQHRPERFPIGVVAYNRPALLKSCLESLLNVTGVLKTQVTLYQDGEDPAVAAVARAAGVNIKQHKGNAGPKGQEGAMRIARHYRWTFSSLFDDNPSSSYAIIVEDDMLFSPDFLSFFVQTAPLYERDPSVYAISSWNDNGQRGLALDPRVLMRTDFFIGLGWMISREIYKKEWEPIWPSTHW